MKSSGDNKTKLKIPSNEVIGYYDGILKKVIYKKPLVSNIGAKPSSSVDTINGFRELEEIWQVKLICKNRKLTATAGTCPEACTTQPAAIRFITMRERK